ncbi:MAG: amino acid transporter [Firmicutes bacterium]|nr:amino acid transporter [Bacillota bacterium]
MSSPSHARVNRFKRVFFGRPKRTDQQHNERLGVVVGLSVFSADALSSVAYAGEEVLLILAVAGAAASVYSLGVGLAIIALIFIVAASYNQTIHAYPNGGGSYIVSKENLGIKAGLTAGAALLVDYVLTVAVSTASGIRAITSALPALQGHEVALCLLAIAFIGWMNLRGVKESGTLFAVPVYGFIVAMFVMIGVGAYRALTGHWDPVAPIAAGFGFGNASFQEMTSGVTMFMLLRAFASGCTALSGIEAVSNGVQAFKKPEAETAIKTMNLSRTILYTMFTGVTLLAYGFRLMPHEGETLLSQIAHVTFGNSIFYYIVQASTSLILLLAANTAYADFPRLAGMIARDGYLPRRLANLGDTLVFHYGVMLLAAAAGVLIVIFKGDIHALIPLYAVGVFLAFTMSQTGMIIHWLKIAKQPGESLKRHWWSVFINTLGALLSAVALIVIGITKFVHGAWIVCIVVPALVAYFMHIHSYYDRFNGRVGNLLSEPMTIDNATKVKVVLTIGGLSPVIDHSMRVARRLSTDITALYVAVEPELGEKLQRKWDLARHGGVPLVVIPSPYREVVEPLRRWLDNLHRENPDTLINLLVPVVVTNEPFDNYLHNGAADQILRDLRYTEGIIVTEIPFYVNMNPTESVLAYDPNQSMNADD